MAAYVTSTGSFLPGRAVGNDAIERYIGSLSGEADVREKVLRMNGITTRYYAQDASQKATHDVYELAACAVRRCLDDQCDVSGVTFLAAGTTNAPMVAPGIASILHDRIGTEEQGRVGCDQPMETSSHAGVCTSSAAALVNAVRAVEAREHTTALAVGAEHASEVLKSSVIKPVDDRASYEDVRHSKWFMSVFLRFMLSDGAGAFLVQDQPSIGRKSFRVDWCYSRSYAHAAPLCMRLDAATGLLSQDVQVLSKHMMPLSESFVLSGLAHHNETLDSYRYFLPHLSSFFFHRRMVQLIRRHSVNAPEVWTNLATAGNTGAASVYVMLDEFARTQSLSAGDRLLLFVPESGQFNFVMVSLTVVER